ncbi:hypothetical protein SELMODRAFT_429658 [Selaginella moellendorffii]|nr:hypothetical protein SELMODRAFT_429658 [Selaginella moellendorffii]
MEVKPLPELRPPKAFFPQAEMIEFRTALEAWQCTPECKKKLSYLYTSISDYGQLQATTQAEMRMRQHWRSLVSESKWRSVLEFGTWFMTVSLRGFKNIAFELASDADRIFKELHDACARGQVPPDCLVCFLEMFLKLMVGGSLVQECGARIKFIGACALLLHGVELRNVDTCWKLLIESTTTLLSEDEDKLLDFLSSECNLSNPLLQSMRAARKNKNADSANPLLAMRVASKNADVVIS